MDIPAWVNGARRSAGLSQRQLAERSGLPQPTIARIERGHQVPRADTLQRLLAACGWELRMGPKRGADVDRSDIREWMELSPADRARGGAEYGRVAQRLGAARRIGKAS